MNIEQKRLFELLVEFDAICKENGLKYFLTGDTLRFALTEGSVGPNAAYASVIMSGDDCRTFASVVNKKGQSGRELDYWGNNPNYPDYTMRYVAADTTAFDLLDFMNYKSHGMYIEIEILRGLTNSKKAKSMRALEKAAVIGVLGDNPDSYWSYKGKDKLSEMYYHAVKMIKGREGIGRDLFEFFSTKCVKPSKDGTYYLCHNDSVIKHIPKELFEGTVKQCEIDSQLFPIPADSELLLKKALGKNPDSFVIDIDRDYSGAIESAGLSDEDFRIIQEADKRFADNERSKKKYFAIARRDWQVVLQTDAMFRMRELYMPKKQEILNLYETGDYKELAEVFAELDEEMNQLLRVKRSLSFDNELMSVYIDTLMHEGQEEKAKNIVRWTPKSHLKEI